MQDEKILEQPTLPVGETKRKPVGSIIFYSIYGAFVLAVVIAIWALMAPLKDWLIRYEAAQPDTMRQQVYDAHFAQPDWGGLYDLAGIQDTSFEGKDAYIAYMTGKLAQAEDPTLVCEETSAGLSGNHKYLLKLNGEKIASFVLTPVDGKDDVTGWQFGGVELFFSREESVTVEKLPGQIVYINGVALDDSYTVRTVSTKAEDYLPAGLQGFRYEQQTITGLLVAPQVTVTDASGQPVTLVTDTETGIMKGENQSSTMQIPQAHKDTAIAAAKNHALFAIRKISSGTLSQYFDPSSQLYKDIVSTTVFLKAIDSYDFRDIAVGDYYSYSDSFFSARICLTMDVHTSKGYTKVFEINTTFFFQKNPQGKFWIVDSTNVDTTQQIEKVRLSFVNGEEQLESMMVDATSAALTTPSVSAPTGQVFKGWAVKSTDDKGNTQMTILFTPDETGKVAVAPSQALEPMVLHAVFAAEE